MPFVPKCESKRHVKLSERNKYVRGVLHDVEKGNAKLSERNKYVRGILHGVEKWHAKFDLNHCSD